LQSLAAEEFNGVSIFGAADSTTLTVSVTEKGATSGSGTVSITKANLNGTSGDVSTITAATTLSGITVDQISTALQNVATSRATNGAESSRLSFAAEMLSANKQNLEAA